MSTHTPKRFLECLLPITECNLRCEYCYVIQKNLRGAKWPTLYSVEQITQALTKERLGGICWISICGAGETFLSQDTVPLVTNLLKNGHYVNVTTNGTITPRIKELCALPLELRERLHLAFSLHYVELKNKNLLQVFVDNIKRVKAAGCSFLVQINLYDGYVPYWDEIKEFSMREFGAPPQVALTRAEGDGEYKIHFSGTMDEYVQIGKKFESPLFDFTVKNFNILRKEFCYAGDWSGTLNLGTGILTSCYGDGISQNIFEDVSRPIEFCAMGKNCKNTFCFNSSHFLSLGVIPSLTTPTYASLRNREIAGWYNPKMQAFLSNKLCQSNRRYSWLERVLSNIRFRNNRNIMHRIIFSLLSRLNRKYNCKP